MPQKTGDFTHTVYTHVQVDCTYKSIPEFLPQTEEKMQDPRISRPPFFTLYMKIYFVTRNEASVRQFNRRSVCSHSVLRSNHAATVCLRPSYRPITVSLFYCRLNDKTRPTDRAVVSCLLPPSAAAWPLARLLLPSICSVVCLPVGRPFTRTLAWQLQRLSPSAAPSAGHPRCRVSCRSPVRRYQVASQIPAETQLPSIVRCSHSLASTSAAAT